MARGNNTEQIDELVAEYVDLRFQRDEAAERLAEVGQKLQDLMEQKALSSHKTRTGAKVTVVERRNESLNEETLRKRIGAQMWNKITTRVLDKHKLDAFIKSGEVNLRDVAMATTVGDTTTYLRVTK